MRDDGDPTHRSLSVRSIDRSLATQPAAGLDPVTNGAHLQLFNANGSGESICLALPAGGWEVSGDAAAPTYRYRDPAFANGPCALVVLRPHRLLKVVCRSTLAPIAFSLDEPAQVQLGIRLASGVDAYCATFGGQVTADEPGTFGAINAPATGMCPLPPIACP